MISLYFGPVVNPQTLSHYQALPRCLIAVGSDGNIIWIEENVDVSAVHATASLRGLKDGEYALLKLNEDACEFIMPGLIDTHVHACQFPLLGFGGDRELLEWLLEYVFPTEAKFQDREYAERVYNDVIDRSIASGTTTSCYYASLHLKATTILADIIHKKGQRAFVGKCNMDIDCPSYYIEESPDASVRDTIALIEHVHALSNANEQLVHPIITPRFALSCSEELLTKLGELAASLPLVPIQTHISENRKEIEATVKRFNAKSYAEVYDRFKLLRNNTILAHGVWLTEEEMDLIAERGAGVAHCPTSNFYLSSGMAKVGLMLDHGVKVGLGSDVSGGNNPSVLYAIQMASTTSKMVAIQAELDEERRQRRREHCKRRRHGKHGRGGHGGHGGHPHDGADAPPTSDSDSDSDRDPHGAAEPETVHDREPHEHGEHGGHHHHHHGHSHRHEHSHGEHHHHPHPHHGEHEHHPHPHHHEHGEHLHHHQRRRHRPPKGPFTDQKLQVATLLYLATLGGAELCRLEDRIGSFAIGKAFDALYVSLDDATAKNPAVWGSGVDEDERVPTEANVRRWLERFLFGGDNRNVRRVFVQGAVIGGEDRNKDGDDVAGRA